MIPVAIAVEYIDCPEDAGWLLDGDPVDLPFAADADPAAVAAYVRQRIEITVSVTRLPWSGV